MSGMKILVIGATGPTGRLIVSEALVNKHEVTAAVRRPESAALPAGVRIVAADVTNASSLIEAVRGQEAVICSLGSKLSRKPTTLLSGGTTNLLSAMQVAGVRRLVCITGIGAGDSKGHGGFLYDRIIQPLLLSEIYKDKTRQEERVRESQTEWTLVRPATLSNGPKTGKIKVYTRLDGVTVGKIPRADVAACVLACVTDPDTVGKTLTITA
jgi:uncharacterized protein YbjT (DUF2867 family)